MEGEEIIVYAFFAIIIACAFIFGGSIVGMLAIIAIILLHMV